MRRARLETGLFALAVGLWPAGCKHGPKPPPPARAAEASSQGAAPPAPQRCHTLGGGASLVIGDTGGPPSPRGDDDTDTDDDEQGLLPFATRVDSAVALEHAFAVGGLTTASSATRAFVALVPLDGGAGRRVDLGPVHGDVDPPLVTGRGDELLTATGDRDPSGGLLRLSRLEPGAAKAEGELRITAVDHDAGAALSRGGERALLVWGTRTKRGTELRALAVEPGKVAAVGAPVELSGTLGAESPALVARPGGYWLAWVSEADTTDAGARAAPRPRADAGSSDELDHLVDEGPRALLVLALDASGHPAGSPRAVNPKSAHVLGFEAALLPDGALALAFRNGDAAPGAERGAPELARVALDGAIEHGTLDDAELSVGAPALLADPAAGGRVWVALESPSEGTRIGPLDARGLSLATLFGDRALRGAEVLAAGAGKLLVGKSRGEAVELSVLECHPGP